MSDEELDKIIRELRKLRDAEKVMIQTIDPDIALTQEQQKALIRYGALEDAVDTVIENLPRNVQSRQLMNKLFGALWS
jgi:hypothetical protein